MHVYMHSSVNTLQRQRKGPSKDTPGASRVCKSWFPNDGTTSVETLYLYIYIYIYQINLCQCHWGRLYKASAGKSRAN